VGYGPANPCRLAHRGARCTPPPSRPRVQCGCKPLSGFKRAEGEIFKCEVVWRFGNTRSEETPPRAGHRHRAEASPVESEPDASRQRLIARHRPAQCDRAGDIGACAPDWRGSRATGLRTGGLAVARARTQDPDATMTHQRAGACHLDFRTLTLRSPVEFNADFPPASLQKWRCRVRCLFDFITVDGTK
jgi:hypothetical protein